MSVEIMAIVNLTPDSFYAASRTSEDNFMATVLQVINDGATIIDIGACSTRPGSTPVDQAEEMRRLERPLTELREAFLSGILPQEMKISIDTFRPEIARHSLEILGRKFILNDVYPQLEFTAKARLCAENGLTWVLTHSLPLSGRKATSAVVDDLKDMTLEATLLGVKNIIVDPGFGFGGKSLEDNMAILRDIDALKSLGYPILAGISRKRMTYEPKELSPEEALKQSLALEKMAVSRGASLLRVHDVAATAAMLKNEF